MALGTRFFGRFEHTLDAKGRVILPAKLRVHFGEPPVGYLTPHFEGCLALWTITEFDAEVESRLAQAGGDAVNRNLVRDWSSGVFEAEIDRQGRMAVPANLRSYASLEQEVLIIGMINRVELWSPRAFADKDAFATTAPVPAGAR